MAAAPVAGSSTPAGFDRDPSVGDLFARVRELDETITALVLADRDDRPAQDERLSIVDQISKTPSHYITSYKIKGELIATLLEEEDGDMAAAMAKLLLYGLEIIERSGA